MPRTNTYSLASSGMMTPSEAALSSMGQNDLVQDTIQSLTDKLGSIEHGAPGKGESQNRTSQVTNRFSKNAPKLPVTPVTGADNEIEHRVYRENWTLSEELRPYDILFD